MSAIDLYAVLGVARDASTDEIRATWKRAVADLDPTDPKLNVFNQAGAVLLDEKRRAEYDAELAAADEVQAPDTPAERPAPAVPLTAPAPASASDDPTGDGRASSGPSSALLAVLAVLTVAAVLAAIFAAGPIGRALPDKGVPAEQARLTSAVAAAEKAAVPVLSYDYRHLEQDKKAATGHLTDDFREDYERTFTLIEQNAPATQTVVAVKVLASAVAGSEGGTVDVLLFVDRPTTKKGSSEPDVFRDQVTFSMRLVEGEWLVDDMRTTRPA
jgi:Mce-associated membrane protein